MRVIIADAAFGGAVPHPALFRLLGFAYEGRHRVIVAGGPAFHRWRSELSVDARERFDVALDTSAELEAREPSEREIRIGPAPGGVGAEEAIEQLERPFLLLLENEESEGAWDELSEVVEALVRRTR